MSKNQNFSNRRQFLKKTAGTTLLFGAGMAVNGLAYSNQWGTNSGGASGITWTCRHTDACVARPANWAWSGSPAGGYCAGSCTGSNSDNKTATFACDGLGGATWCQWD